MEQEREDARQLQHGEVKKEVGSINYPLEVEGLRMEQTREASQPKQNG